MKKIIVGSLLLLSFSIFAEEIVVYGPSTSKWIGKKYGPVFEKMTGDTIKYVSIDGVVQRLTLEKINPKADIVVGLTPVDIELAKKHGVIQKYKPQNVRSEERRVGKECRSRWS